VIALNNKSLPTTDEIVNTLKRSFLPIIVIEGTDDVYIYRWLKTKLSNSLVALQSTGGRNNLFAIHDRKSEFPNKKVIFIADKDSYRFDGVPSNRQDIIFTSGYCIENDIYHGSNVCNLLDDEDLNDFEVLKKVIIRWFSFELEQFNQRKLTNINTTLKVANHINVVSPVGVNDICPSFKTKIGFKEPCPSVIQVVENEYALNLRGKQLFQILTRFMSKKGRFSSFSDKNLIEIALKQGNNDSIQRLVSEIDIKLTASP
jgi:hypothetical protein